MTEPDRERRRKRALLLIGLVIVLAAGSMTAFAAIGHKHHPRSAAGQAPVDPSPLQPSASLPVTATPSGVISKDANGNVTVDATTAVRDRTAPPVPTITSTPGDPATSSSARFTFVDSEAAVTFSCSLDASAFQRCASPLAVTVAAGSQQHSFEVRAVDPSGNTSRAATFRWRVATPTSGMPFTITGTSAGLAPGVWRTIAVKLSNPNPVPISVTVLAVSVAPNSTPTGCPSSTNIELQQANISPAHVVVVPAKSSVDLPAQGIAAPQIRLLDLPTVNQDVCKGKTFAMSYSGSAHS